MEVARDSGPSGDVDQLNALGDVETLLQSVPLPGFELRETEVGLGVPDEGDQAGARGHLDALATALQGSWEVVELVLDGQVRQGARQRVGKMPATSQVGRGFEKGTRHRRRATDAVVERQLGQRLGQVVRYVH